MLIYLGLGTRTSHILMVEKIFVVFGEVGPGVGLVLRLSD